MSEPWNHGKISRQTAERLLANNGCDGAFLVRQSESVEGAYVLSMWGGKMVHHFRVLMSQQKFTVQGPVGTPVRYFANLSEVIKLFKHPDQGLPYELKEAINKESTDASADSDDEEQEEECDMDNVDGPGPVVSEPCTIALQLIEKMSEMDMSRIDNDFSRKLQSYLNIGFSRDEPNAETPAIITDLIQELMACLGEKFQSGLKDFLRKIEFMQEVFSVGNDATKLACIPSTTGSTGPINQASDVSDFEQLFTDFARCLTGVKRLNTLVENQRTIEKHIIHQSQIRTFDVHTCGNFKTKAFLKVDAAEGKLWFMKNECDSMEDSNIVSHDKILQLVKDPESPKLTFKIDNKSNREYVFKNIQARENFCQVVQYMKKLCAPAGSEEDPKDISVFVGTWNMGSAAPPGIESWVKCSGIGEVIKDECVGLAGHDVYAFGTQESSAGENAWISKLTSALKKRFNKDYYTVAVHSLWGIRLVILAKVDHQNRISHVLKSSVKTGIANKLGNKGGVGIAFDFLSTSLCFINTHLASGNEELRKARRQQNYVDILMGLNLGQKSAYDLTNQFHHVFWFGDLNYRIDLGIDDIKKAIAEKDYKKLSVEDQLQKEQKAGKVFYGFYEHDINFPPTYRYKRGTRNAYEHEKMKRSGLRINVPSWCDRVLWKSFPELYVKPISYGCTNDIVTSDHSPVFASFEVSITSQFAAASQDHTSIQTEPKKSSSVINIQFVKANVNTRSKTNFYLEFHSACLAASQRTSVGKPSPSINAPRNVDSNPTMVVCTEWESEIKLCPIYDDKNYLIEQHLMIAVKSESGDESYGECVLSLKPHAFPTPQKFQADLTHGGIKTGKIEGSMNVCNPKMITQLRPASRPIHETAFRTHSAANPVNMHRPISCISPNMSDFHPPPPLAKKSVSLGRSYKRSSSDSLAGYAPKVTPSIYKVLEYPRKGKSETVVDKAPTIPRKNPPPLPAKTMHVNGTLSTPSTPPPRPLKRTQAPTIPKCVEDFLSKLGLTQYLCCFLDNGFEEMLFLECITEDDLVNVGIENREHVDKILKEVEFLKQSGLFNYS